MPRDHYIPQRAIHGVDSGVEELIPMIRMPTEQIKSSQRQHLATLAPSMKEEILPPKYQGNSAVARVTFLARSCFYCTLYLYQVGSLC